ncbi:CAP domain-containing protein [Paenibacillus kobensis]|uniref:CAP domain-containing protein n=1 Tax=Paenibacillus kobensis TaxID=59841 RepID=UPI0013E3D2C0|nr:CAP domain-containing protein [Paenibacillus kobensis]
MKKYVAAAVVLSALLTGCGAGDHGTKQMKYGKISAKSTKNSYTAQSYPNANQRWIVIGGNGGNFNWDNIKLPAGFQVYPQYPSNPSNPSYPTTPAQPTTPAKPATPPTTPTGGGGTSGGGTTGTASTQAKQVLDLVNAQRKNNGLGALTLDSALSNMALVKAKDMINNNYFDHNSPTYGSPFDMMKQFGISYRSAGENIAKGQTTAQQVMNDWMNSAGHRANILNSSYTKLGVGFYNNAWVQEFTG